MFRLYVDEVGTDALTHLDDDNHRYLSLTGVAMKITVARDELTPRFDKIKADIFNHDPDDPVVFHRTHIVKKTGNFHRLVDPELCARFDAQIMEVVGSVEYSVITAMIDKKGLMSKETWRNKHPYNFLMEILVEKYTQFLERKNDIGDIMPEARMGKKDTELQKAFSSVRRSGTYYISASRMQQRIPSKSLKFRYKKDNIAGLQLCDLLAHPSHMHVRKLQRHPVTTGKFCQGIQTALIKEKYDRSSNSGIIIGYGVKWLP